MYLVLSTFTSSPVSLVATVVAVIITVTVIIKGRPSLPYLYTCFGVAGTDTTDRADSRWLPQPSLQ